MDQDRIVKLLFAAVAAVGVACTAHQTPQTPPDRIVVVFSPRPEIPNRYDYPSGGYGIHNRPILSLRTEKPGEQIPPVDSLSTDTLSIPVTGQRVVLAFRYNFASEAELLLHNGDTVLVRMGADSLPQIEVTNRTVNAADLNFDAMRAQRYGRRYGFTTTAGECLSRR